MPATLVSLFALVHQHFEIVLGARDQIEERAEPALARLDYLKAIAGDLRADRRVSDRLCGVIRHSVRFP